MNRIARPHGIPLFTLLATLVVARGLAQSVGTPGSAPVVTVATLTPESATNTGIAVGALSPADRDRTQVGSLADALDSLPDVVVFSAGQTGSAASVYLRGASPVDTLFVVDGIRFSDPNTGYGMFLGGWRPGPADRLEVAYGPESSLYGASAVGGAITLNTPKGAGAPTEALSFGAGSFGTIDGSASAQGVDGKWAYDAEIGLGRTDNDRPHNDFDSGDFALRLDRALSPGLTVGGTIRGLDTRYDDPGSTYVDSLTNYEREKDWLGTLFVDDRISDNVSARITAGAQDQRLDTSTSGAVAKFGGRRIVLDGQVTVRLTATDQLIAGVDAEDKRAEIISTASLERNQNLRAFFVENLWQLTQDISLAGSFRRDDYAALAEADTGRATLAWFGGEHKVKLRGSFGTGVNAPSLIDLYSRSPMLIGNPNLHGEHARGWDAGFDAYLTGNQTFSVTAYRTDYDDLIETDYMTAPATVINVAEARIEGVEAALQTPWGGGVQTRIAYDGSKAEDEDTQSPLPFRPEQSGSADLWDDLGQGWSAGIGGTYVGSRPDFVPRMIVSVTDPQYTVVRAYVKWQATKNLALRVRVENALAESYDETNGYPALGRVIFGGAEWQF